MGRWEEQFISCIFINWIKYLAEEKKRLATKLDFYVQWADLGLSWLGSVDGVSWPAFSCDCHSFLSNPETNPSKTDFPLSMTCLCSVSPSKVSFPQLWYFRGIPKGTGLFFDSSHHYTESNFYMPLYYEWNASAMSFTGSLSSTSDSSISFSFPSFRHDWWDWRDTCWKVKTSVKVFAFSAFLIRIVFSVQLKVSAFWWNGKVCSGWWWREKWKACLPFGSRNMMELKQEIAQLDLNSDQFQQVKAVETRLHISSGICHATIHFLHLPTGVAEHVTRCFLSLSWLAWLTNTIDGREWHYWSDDVDQWYCSIQEVVDWRAHFLFLIFTCFALKAGLNLWVCPLVWEMYERWCHSKKKKLMEDSGSRD